ncbi:flavodoxin-dependent (E)-4-hydroxy-3-methylbut-2-enyl-diphosphate synthase [Tissierella creatinophila]|uniref:4-hydroxy-3-methylbut-2-en-1-yl diphosphate synthase (flavodoxin) n=1 Tax=Tissierella creatinophila DSM 6911 TaxID=1123403 RepID=A0A1U7M370_TISCR|nr:flavodoxin-dependent (E)-4-hydroxy-3-methylbut-2-enyl-diphosphate synthase [Tissierella creatinophila]OLS01757.1 4-hydroxy-3-methylbut-2-en-1-yl diphosphate synthase [Tissierella creatinophila DSM 6911]
MRKNTKVIKVGNKLIGGNNPITIQSMTNTITKDINATIRQINRLEKAGCDIIRMAISDNEDAQAIKTIKQNINIPIIADIQYDYRLALESIKYGVDGLRINPGNIGSLNKVKQIVDACRENQISIRIGVNSGSIKKEYLDKYNGVNENSMVESALEQIRLLEELDFKDIKISLKASNVPLSIKSYTRMSELRNYPLHLGITEAGPGMKGTIKSSVGIGALLAMGIGDTIRVSLTDDPIEEIKVGREILKSLGLLKGGLELISCPTCGRTKIDLINIVKEAEKKLEGIDKNLKVAIMGCPVNGPGEAKEADIGIAGGNGEGIIFIKGKIVKKVKEEKLLEELVKEIRKIQ